MRGQDPRVWVCTAKQQVTDACNLDILTGLFRGIVMVDDTPTDVL